VNETEGFWKSSSEFTPFCASSARLDFFAALFACSLLALPFRSITPPRDEIELGRRLVEKLSSETFEPENYEDEYRNRLLAMIDEKTKGHEITILPRAPARDPHLACKRLKGNVLALGRCVDLDRYRHQAK
jgi:Fe2+ transport system protein FeoA